MPEAPHQELDLTRPRRIHLIGVGGPAINSLASMLAAMGHRVSGCDLKESAGLDRLRAQGVEVSIPNGAEHVADAELVGRSTAVPDRKVEVQAAVHRGLPLLSRADLLVGISRGRATLAIAGTHGTTTTTAMTALAMVETGLQPSYLLGGDVNEIGSGAVWDDDGEWFVVEAHHGDSSFPRLRPTAAVVTNIELDDLDQFTGTDELEDAFARCAGGAERLRLFCADDPGAARVAARVEGTTYGIDPGADWRAVDVTAEGMGSTFRVLAPDGRELPVRLHVPGLHNVRNATAALAATVSLRGDADAAAAALGRFAGVARRFEFRGEAAGVTVVDDSARVPGEVRGTVQAAAAGRWQRVVAVFQAHRYQRVQWFWREFGAALDGADQVVIVEPHPELAETPAPGVSGMLLVRGVLAHRPRADVAYVPNRTALRTFLLARLHRRDICVIIQAGGALTDFADELLGALASRPERTGAA